MFSNLLPKLKENVSVILQNTLYVILALGFILLGWKSLALQGSINNLQGKYSNFQSNLVEELFNDHLLVQQSLGLNSQLENLEAQLKDLLALPANAETIQIREIYTLYADFNSKLSRNSQAGLDVTAYSGSVAGWGDQLLNKKFEELKTSISENTAGLEDSYQEYLASLPPPPTSAEGYSYQTVSTSMGSFGVYLIKMPLSEVRVVTAAASDGDCSDGCATKSLAQHVSDNGGFAGMNGSYFCPPDYESCNGKTNSSDYAFYKSSAGKWLNKDALSWSDTGLATFNGSSARFYKRSSDYGSGGVTAGISNYPTLLEGGNVVVNEDKLTSFQTAVKGPRGVIGVGESNVYLAIVTVATVTDAAYVSQALGMQNALNLDGGGSSAMYINGGYAVGPGRSLPNAVVLVR